MDLLNFLVTQHIDLLALSTFYNGQWIRVKGSRFMFPFYLIKVKALFYTSNFDEVHAASGAIRMCTADVNDIYFFS